MWERTILGIGDIAETNKHLFVLSFTYNDGPCFNLSDLL